MEFSAQSIRNHVGSTSFERGRNYFTSGNVIAVSIDEDSIFGSVLGSQKRPYETSFTLKDSEIIDSECSCPVGYACKHVAALGLASLLEFVKTAPTQKVSQPSKQIKPKEPPVPWKQTLSQLLSASRIQTDKSFQLQLLLKVEQQYSYSGKTGNFRLMLRPRLFDPKSGKFSVTEIKWADAEYYSGIYWEGTYGQVAQNQLIFLKLIAAGLDDRYPSGWEEVAEDKADYFWHILRQHQAYGVTLVAGNKGQIPVTLASQPIETKLEISEKEKGLMIEKKIFYEDKDITYTQIAFIGQPPAFALCLGYNHYTLYPVGSGSVPDNMLEAPLKIPQKDIPRLQKDYLKSLINNFTVVSHTSAVTLPKMINPNLLLTLTPTKGWAIEIKLGFIYQDIRFPFYVSPEMVTINKESYVLNKQVIESGHERFEATLRKYDLFEPDEDDIPDTIYLSGIEAARFIAETLPSIQSDLPDLEVIASPDIPHFVYEEAAPEILLRIDENEETHDWFDLNVTVNVGDEVVPFQELFQALADGQKFLLLSSGRYFSLESKEFEELRKLLNEAKSIQEKGVEGIRLNRFQAGLWEELTKAGIVTAQSKRWQETMVGLLTAKGVTVQTPPKKFSATLRPYQLEGYSWLIFLRQYKLGGILADDMGLGKTIQTIAFICKAKSEKEAQKPFLVVAPTSVVENWDMELVSFAPSLKKVIMRAGDRSKQVVKIEKADIVVVSYALLLRDFEKIKDIAFDSLILDEAQMVKNYQSKAYSLVRKLKADCKIALTGTPLENNLMELWSIFSVVAPGLFSSPEKFRENYKTPIEKDQNREILDNLKKRIRPFLLRRQKVLVEKDLPLKSEQVLYLPLNDAHRHLYDLHLQHERKRVLGMLQNGGLADHRFEILRSLTKLRQLCLHPKLLDEKHTQIPPTKIEALREQLEEILAEEHKVLIFSQFTSFLAHVKKMLDQAGYNYLYLAGETKNRGELIKQFHQDASVPIFLISLKAGGFGLNLTAADYCILLDPWWNPAVEQQAIDRTHRIGQTKPVFVYKIIAKDTIEEKVLALQEKKRKLFQNVLDEESLFSTMVSEEDIKNIFAI